MNLADVRRLVAENHQEPPDGYVPIREAAARMGCSEARAYLLARAGKVAAVTVRRNGQRKRFVRAADCRSAAPREPEPGPRADDPPDPLDPTPVLYGLLSAADARELGRRRARAG